MTDPLLSVAFDEASLGEITHIANFSKTLDTEIGKALPEIGEVIVQAAQANTWVVFANPTGKLAGEIRAILGGPLSVEIDVGVPYAWRMEEGFHGADSLGRVYDEDGKPYMRPALTANEDKIASMMNLAVAEAFAAMGVGV